jgi:hypothetical protein
MENKPDDNGKNNYKQAFRIMQIKVILKNDEVTPAQKPISLVSILPFRWFCYRKAEGNYYTFPHSCSSTVKTVL